MSFPADMEASFETLAKGDNTSADGYRAAERIRQYLTAVTKERDSARDAALEEAAEKCHALGLGTKGWTARAPARITKMCEDAIRTMKGGGK